MGGPRPGEAHQPALLEALRRAGVDDQRIIEAFGQVDRAEFLPRSARRAAGRDAPIPIGHDQTTSQPSLIARMVEAMELQPDDRVLEIGTGSGYQTAVLARLAAHVTSVETVASLAEAARGRLAHVANVEVIVGDGTLGWEPNAPYDAITVGAAGPHVPRALTQQLADGGRLIIPVDHPGGTMLEVHRRVGEEIRGPERLLPVRFVPLTGADGHPG